MSRVCLCKSWSSNSCCTAPVVLQEWMNAIDVDIVVRNFRADWMAVFADFQIIIYTIFKNRLADISNECNRYSSGKCPSSLNCNFCWFAIKSISRCNQKISPDIFYKGTLKQTVKQSITLVSFRQNRVFPTSPIYFLSIEDNLSVVIHLYSVRISQDYGLS